MLYFARSVQRHDLRRAMGGGCKGRSIGILRTQKLEQPLAERGRL
jgi:hypothetical protein